MQRGYRHGHRHLSVIAQRSAGGRFTVTVDDRAHDVEVLAIEAATVHLVVDGHVHQLHLARVGDADHVSIDGSVYVLALESAGETAAGLGAALAAPQILAPMPGKVLEVLVHPGQAVNAGDGLLILEAMKMEHRMEAEAAATVRAVHVVDGQMVDAGAVLVELQYSDGGEATG